MFTAAQNSAVGDICQGCLTKDRDLTILLPDYLQVYHYILGQNQCLLDQKNSTYCISMCWECKAMLHKFMRFRTQLHRAQGCLQTCDASNILAEESLSNLTIISQTTIREILYHDYKDRCKADDGNDDYDDAECDDDINEESLALNSDKEEMPCAEDRLKVETGDGEPETKLQKHGKRKKVKHKKGTLDAVTKSSSYFKKIFITELEFLDLSKREKGSNNFEAKLYKCEKCRRFGGVNNCGCQNVSNFDKKNTYANNRNTHLAHECVLCKFICFDKGLQKQHILSSHSNSYMCELCQRQFQNVNDFNKHTKDLHTHLICDMCSKRFLKKRSMESHIRRNHSPRTCALCSRSYRTYHSLENHYRLVHPHILVKGIKSEDSYCVECDKQFSSVYKYKNHLRTSVRHSVPKRVKVPCPECDKVFSRTTYMNNHYKLTHVKRSKHYCQLCDKYYITAFSLRQHTRLVHEKVAQPRNKVCKICGKGFSTNRTLLYHTRTHTGERPHRCTFCAATFSQKKSMTSHLRTVHSQLDSGVLQES